MSDEGESRYDAITALTEDVALLMKEVSKLINTSNKRGREVLELSNSNSEIVVFLRDMKNLVSKEAIQRLHQQISTTSTTEINNLGRSLRDDLLSRLKEQVTPDEVSGGLNELEALFRGKLEGLEKNIRSIEVGGHGSLTSLRDDILSKLEEFRSNYPTEERVKELLESRLTEDRLNEVASTVRQEVTDLLSSYVKKGDILPSSPQETYASKETAIFLREGIDELRTEQEKIKHNSVSREHVSILKGDFEDVRTRCEVLENKLENVKNTLTVPTVDHPSETIALLQQQIKELAVLLPENKIFVVDSGVIKYMKVGGNHFLLSSGFPLVAEETKFELKEIELPDSKLLLHEGEDYSSTLSADGWLVFHRKAEAVVKRFMFWY